MLCRLHSRVVLLSCSTSRNLIQHQLTSAESYRSLSWDQIPEGHLGLDEQVLDRLLEGARAESARGAAEEQVSLCVLRALGRKLSFSS